MITGEQKSRYIKYGGYQCPSCESLNFTLTENEPGVGVGEKLEFMICIDCGIEWVNTYKLIDMHDKEKDD